MKTLLVPTNFSSIEKNALSFASDLAQKLNAKITLLHAYHIYPTQSRISKKRYEEEIEIFRKEAEIRLKEFCTKIKNTSASSCDFINSEGFVKETIVRYANEIKPDLLILGTENISYTDRILFGTITGKVIKEVDCTVLVVPEETSFESPKKIAFAMDYHDSDMEDIRFLVKLAQKFKSKLHIIHVILNSENEASEVSFFNDNKKEIIKTFPEENITFQLIKGKNISKELRKYAAKVGIDVLAVAKAKLNQLERFFSGSVSQNLFNHSNIPLLIFQAEDEPNDFF